jgi:hypothetical protein
MYNPRSARAVSARSAAAILEIVNKHNFQIDPEKSEVWHVYDVDQWDRAYEIAQYQKFTIRNGIVKAIGNLY